MGLRHLYPSLQRVYQNPPHVLKKSEEFENVFYEILFNGIITAIFLKYQPYFLTKYSEFFPLRILLYVCIRPSAKKKGTEER